MLTVRLNDSFQSVAQSRDQKGYVHNRTALKEHTANCLLYTSSATQRAQLLPVGHSPARSTSDLLGLDGAEQLQELSLIHIFATLVSSQNDCAYCADSHGFMLRMNGGSAETLCAIQENKLRSPSLSEAEQALLTFVEKINGNSQAIGPADILSIREAGWDDAQIAEAIHVAALFATFNRDVYKRQHLYVRLRCARRYVSARHCKFRRRKRISPAPAPAQCNRP